MFRLLDAEPKKLSGTMSTNGCSGPRWRAASVLSPLALSAALAWNCASSLALVASGSLAPGWRTLTTSRPMVTATAVVAMYKPMVLLPMRDSFLKSERDATPETREVRTSGTAMSLSRFMKMSPKGTTQLFDNFTQLNWAALSGPATDPSSSSITTAMAKRSPRIIPRMICQWSFRYHFMPE